MDFRFGFYMMPFDRDEFKAVNIDAFIENVAKDSRTNYYKPVVMGKAAIDVFSMNPVYQFFVESKGQFFCDDSYIDGVVNDYGDVGMDEVVEEKEKAGGGVTVVSRDIGQRMIPQQYAGGGYYEMSYVQINIASIYEIVKKKLANKSSTPNYIVRDDPLLVKQQRNEYIAKIRLITGINTLQDEYKEEVLGLQNMNVEQLRQMYEIVNRRYNMLKCHNLVESGLTITNELLDKLLPNGMCIGDKVVNIKKLPATLQEVMLAENSVVNTAVQGMLSKYSINIPDEVIVLSGLATAFMRGIEVEDKKKVEERRRMEEEEWGGVKGDGERGRERRSERRVELDMEV